MPRTQQNPADTKVGALVKYARMSRGLSQSDLGRKLGVTFQQVQKYENGKNRIAPSKLAKIAESVERPVSFFFESARLHIGNNVDKPLFDFLTSSEGVAIIQVFAKLTPTQRKAIAHFICDMALLK